MASATVTGIAEILRAVGRAKSDTAVKVADGLEKCAGVVYRKSQKYVPRDTNALAESGKVEVTGVGMGARATVTYGGPDAPYALYVHEDMTKYHKEPTCAKFLERAAVETRGTCASIMERTVQAQTTYSKDGEAAPAQLRTLPGEFFDV